MGRVGCSLLRIHGVCMGWICVHHELATIARIRIDLHGEIQRKTICQLHHVVCDWNFGQHADSIRWFPPNQE